MQDLRKRTKTTMTTVSDTSQDAQTNDLENALRSLGAFENEEELAHRESVLAKLDGICQTWIEQQFCDQPRSPLADEKTPTGKTFPFGSHKLGVNCPGGDVDVLLVLPIHVKRRAVFSSLLQTLKTTSGIENVQAVPEAYVPVMKMRVDGVNIDLIFAFTSLTTLSDNFDPQTIANSTPTLDPRCVRSINGYVVTEEILRLVPNHLTFQLALRTIKTWAKRRGLYSNLMGFLGGVSWTILVADVCRHHPHAPTSYLVRRFFKLHAMWKWPRPIALKPMGTPDFQLGQAQWDPRVNPHDAYHLMPILTPATPRQNSSYNVTVSAGKVMREEFCRGLRIATDIADGKSTWLELFQEADFLRRYQNFFVVKVAGDIRWTSFVETKLRFLVQCLEKYPDIDRAHVNTQRWKIPEAAKESSAKGKSLSTGWILGIEFHHQPRRLDEGINEFVDSVCAQARRGRLWKVGMTVEVQQAKQRELKNHLWLETSSKREDHGHSTPLPGKMLQEGVVQETKEEAASGDPTTGHVAARKRAHSTSSLGPEKDFCNKRSN